MVYVSGLLFGSFFKIELTKAWNYTVPTFITKSSVMILDKSSFFLILNGF